MKVFFGGSPRALKKYKKEHEIIYKILEDLGCQHLNDIPVKSDPVKFYQQNEREVIEMYRYLMGKLHQAEVVLIEASIHSLTMGYYIKAALDLDKPVIILHLPDKKPFFFSGIVNDKLQIVEYTPENIAESIKNALTYAKQEADVRFNLFLSADLSNYLKWAAQKFNTQRANFIRSLIIQHKNAYLDEYQQDIQK